MRGVPAAGALRILPDPEVDGQLVVIANVPARVNTETGEQLFAPATVERLQKMIWERKPPSRIISIPVYEYS